MKSVRQSPSASVPTPDAPTRDHGLRINAWTLGWPLMCALLAAVLAWALIALAGLAPAAAAALASALALVVAVLPLTRLVRRVALASARADPRPARAPDLGSAASAFLDRANRELARARRYDCGAALLLVEVEFARQPIEGDMRPDRHDALAELQRQTALTLRSADLLARFSGNQMMVLLTPADATGALDVAERIRECAAQIEHPGPLAGPPSGPDRPRITASIGVAVLRPASPGGADLAMLIEDAGQGVQAARLAGGNCVRAAAAGGASLRLPSRPGRRAQPK